MLLCLDDANINIVIWDTMAVIGLPVGVAGEEKILWENGLMLLAYDEDLNRYINRLANRFTELNSRILTLTRPPLTHDP